jgi:multicomponent Na+:H+ antiporter subunit E
MGYPATMKAVAVLLLVAVWLILAGNVQPATVFAGIGLCIAAVVIFSPLAADQRASTGPASAESPGDAGTAPVSILRRAVFAVAFVPVFLGKVLLSGLGIAFLALKPSIDFWPGIVRVQGGLRSPVTTTIFANVITLTPGTLTLDYDEETDGLYVHWIDVTGYATDFDHRVTSGMRVWMKRLEG